MKEKIIQEEIKRLKKVILKDRKKEIPPQIKSSILHSLSIIETILWIKKGTKEYNDLYALYNKKRIKKVKKGVLNRKKLRGECVDCSKPVIKGTIRCWYHNFMNNLNSKIRRKNYRGNENG